MLLKTLIKILLIIVFLSTSTNSLKRNKNNNSDKKQADQTINNAPVTKIQEKPKQQKKQATQMTHTTTIQNKQTKPIENQQISEKSQQEQQQEQKNEIVDMKGSYSFSFEPKQNQYVIPISVGSQKFNLALVYDEKQAKNGKQLPWLFTSLSGQDRELCDAGNDCQKISNIVKCESDKSKTQQNCVYAGKAKYSTEQMLSKKKAKIKFKNNKSNYQMNFISPIKINMKQNKVAQNQISGLINLALDKEEKYGKSIVVTNKQIKIIPQKQIQQTINKEGIIELTKTSFFSFSSNKQLHLRTIHRKTKQVSTEIKQSYQKIKIKFNNVQQTMAVNKNILLVIKSILKKQYFGDRCKIKQDTITCSAPPVKNISKLSFCRDSSSEKCLQLPILKWVIKQEKQNNVYKLLIEENKDIDEETTIILYPRLAQICQIYTEKGVVTGIKQIQKDSQEDQVEQKAEEQQSQQSPNIVATPVKQVKKQEQKPKQKEPQQDTEQQTQQQQQKQTKNTKKQISQKQKDDEDVQDDEQQEKSQQKNAQSQPKSLTKPSAKASNIKKKAKDDQDDQQQEVQQKPRKKTKVKHMEGDGKQGSRQEQRKYSKGILFFVFVYGFIFIIILIIIKFKAQQSIAAAAIDKFLDITWYGIVKNYFNKSKGYNATKFEEDEGGHSQQIDHSDSVAVGYTEKQGRDLFWEKNSVEGI